MHSDIVSKVPPMSEGHHWDFTIFIYDYTRFIRVYFLKEKSKVFGIFKSSRQWWEIKSTRNSRSSGVENKSQMNLKNCESVGIRRQLTTSYSAQQNIVVERKIRTIHDMANSMLQEKRMPKFC